VVKSQIQLSVFLLVIIMTFALINGYGVIFIAVNKAVGIINSPAPFVPEVLKGLGLSLSGKRCA